MKIYFWMKIMDYYKYKIFYGKLSIVINYFYIFIKVFSYVIKKIIIRGV